MNTRRILVVIALVLSVVTLLPAQVALPIAPLPVAVFCLCLAQLI